MVNIELLHVHYISECVMMKSHVIVDDEILWSVSLTEMAGDCSVFDGEQDSAPVKHSSSLRCSTNPVVEPDERQRIKSLPTPGMSNQFFFFLQIELSDKDANAIIMVMMCLSNSINKMLITL